MSEQTVEKAGRPTPYYEDDLVTLYHGHLEDVLPSLGQFAACVTDPPYGQTSLSWDRWPTGWVDDVAEHTASLWCFGTFRMFLERQSEFGAWKLAQDVIWEKTRATSVTTDRFRRRHEMLTHWYRGAWGDIYRDLPKVPSGRTTPQKSATPAKTDPTPGQRVYSFGLSQGWVDDGLRYMTSIITAATIPSRDRKAAALNATQKPVPLLEPLIRYSVPEGGVVLDPFAGSASTGIAARNLGRKAVLIEAREEQCETAAARLSQSILLEGEPA